MGNKYFQLTYQDRVRISHWRTKGLTLAEIARRVGVHKSTISREIRRNSRTVTRDDQIFYFEMSLLGFPKRFLRKHLEAINQHKDNLQDRHCWGAIEAQRKRQHRLLCANQLRRRKSTLTLAWVREKLKAGWSPKQIAGRSKLDGPEPVSYEFIYRLIHEDKKRGGNMHRLLPRYGRRKQRFGKRSYSQGPIIPHRKDIRERPDVVDKRSRLGDLEGDLIQGHLYSGYVLSLIDRKSRYLILRKLRTKRKRTVRRGLEVAIRSMRHAKTLTLDNGSEFCDHRELTKNTGVPVYFATPYRSTDRGTNENANGLVRRYLPKKMSFHKLTQSRLNQIATAMNRRPRACLGYLTPYEVQFRKGPKISSKSVALVI